MLGLDLLGTVYRMYPDEDGGGWEWKCANQQQKININEDGDNVKIERINSMRPQEMVLALLAVLVGG